MTTTHEQIALHERLADQDARIRHLEDEARVARAQAGVVSELKGGVDELRRQQIASDQRLGDVHSEVVAMRADHARSKRLMEWGGGFGVAILAILQVVLHFWPAVR